MKTRVDWVSHGTLAQARHGSKEWPARDGNPDAMLNRMSLGIVIPTYNRRENLLLALEALGRQTANGFPVVVADDGSTDGTREALEELASTELWHGRLRYVDCGSNTVARPGQARNLGVQQLPSECSLAVMLDSDALLAEDAVERFDGVHRHLPTAVVMGITDWMPPQALRRVRQVMRDVGLDPLRTEAHHGPARRIGWTYAGPELRLRMHSEIFAADTAVRCAVRPDWVLSSNTAFPVGLFEALGGFDANMTGYGYEDFELGLRLSAAGAECVVCPQIWSLHIWHRKRHPEMCRLESQRNLDYLLRKHRTQVESEWKSFEKRVDWSCWWHYHRCRGGKVVRVVDDLYAVSRTGTHRLRLDGPEWVARLGHRRVLEALDIWTGMIAGTEDMGLARLTILDQ